MPADPDPLADAEAILAADEARYDEADGLLDHARADAHALRLRRDRFRYAACRAHLAELRGARDEAAAFAMGALWQAAEDEAGPQLQRHPDVGRVRTGEATLDALWDLADAGDPEAFDPLTDDYRSPGSGQVQWHWSLVERLRPNPAVVGRRHAAIVAARTAAEPLLMELRAAGIPAYDLADFAQQRLPSKQAAEILVAWLARIEDPLARTHIAAALSEAKARPVATVPLLELFATLPNDAEEKDRVANAVGMLARGEHLDAVAALARDPRHGHHRDALFWAVGHMGAEPGALDLCLELLDDPLLGGPALRALTQLRSERARPVLERIAAEPVSDARDPDAVRRRDRARMARRGLEQLDRAPR